MRFSLGFVIVPMRMRWSIVNHTLTQEVPMTSRYQANGTVVELKFWNGETEERARCLKAEQAAILLNKAADLNESRKYTASAKTLYQAEQLPGFYWID